MSAGPKQLATAKHAVRCHLLQIDFWVRGKDCQEVRPKSRAHDNHQEDRDEHIIADIGVKENVRHCAYSPLLLLQRCFQKAQQKHQRGCTLVPKWLQA
mmetsp:Transcript_86031/g.162098  ORF Transcript_86031/g.162098 Transcript_86031/m.162098 type:complete len:98 (-) Transcript_86031:6-299(-)